MEQLVLIEMAHGRHLLVIALFSSLSIASSAKQSFKLVFSDIKCTVNDNYVRSKSCILEKSANDDAKLNIEAQMQKRLQQMRLDYSVNLDRLNKDTISIYKITNMDGCTAMFKNITSPLLKMLRDLLLRYGDWPAKCPTDEDYLFKFTGITLDTSYLPSFLPEADFRVLLTLHDRSVRIWHVQIFGRVTHQRKFKPKQQEAAIHGNALFLLDHHRAHEEEMNQRLR